MDFMLDMKTIFICLVVGHLSIALIISTYLRSHKKDKIIHLFFLAKCMQATAWLIVTNRNGIPDILTISLMNTLTFLGDSVEMVAVLRLRKRFDSITKRFYIILTLTIILGFHFILLFHNDENVRIAFASLAVAALLILPSYQLIQKDSSSFTKFMGYFYLFVIVFFVGRTAYALLNSHSIGFYSEGMHQTISFLALFLFMIFQNTGFLLMLKEDSDQELWRLASVDDLTNILNRRTFVGRANKCLAEYAKSEKPISFMIFDVDYFKNINDLHGHIVGDQVLQDLTAKISQILGDKDLFGRYGGDEFAILLPGKDEKESTRFAESIRQVIAGSNIRGIPLLYSLSMGLVTVVPDHDTQMETLYISCDKALYAAKKQGRNCVYRINSLQSEDVNQKFSGT